MTENELVQTALVLLGKATAFVAGSAAVLWAGARLFGKAWVDHYFARDIEAFKAKADQELEHVRHRLNTTLQRTSKLHEKEFEVLAEAWEKLNKALGHAALVVSILESFPTLNDLSEEAFEDFVATSNLRDFDKNALRKAPDRDAYYRARITLYRLRDARKAANAFHRTIQRNSIFIEPKIRRRFEQIDGLMYETVISREIGEEAGDRRIWIAASQKLRNEAAPLKDEIQRFVQERLGYDLTATQ